MGDSTHNANDPLDRVTLDESVTMALHVTLESLTPEQRIPFILHDVFGMPFATVGDIVGRSASASRELATAARRSVHARRARADSNAEHSAVVHRVRLACEAADALALEQLFDPGVVALTDSGGRVAAVQHPVTGATEVARLLCEALSPADLTPAEELSIAEQPVNGQNGLVVRRNGRVCAVLGLGISASLVTDVWLIVNPQKLRRWNTP